MRLDETARAAYHHEPNAKGRELPVDEETGNVAIPMSNVKGIRALFKGIAVRKAARFGKGEEE